MSDGTATAVGDVLRILVVGDSEPVDAAMAALSGRLESVSLLRERTLESGLERLTRLAVHCVVCPFGTGGAGPSVLERLRERDETLPIVAVLEGGSTDDGTTTAALEAGATDVVEADDPASLVATRVRNAGERYRLATASTRRGRSPLEHSEAVVWVLDPDGRLEYASPAVESQLGYTPAELERTPLSQLVHPDDRETALETLESISAAAVGTTDRATVRIGHADGSWVVSELACTNRLADPAVEGIVLTLSTASVPEPDESVRTALDRLADPLFSLGPRWELRYANDATSKLFVADAAPEPGTVVWDLLAESVRGRFAERFREATTTGQVVTFETAYPPLGGRLVVSVHPGEDGVTVSARETPESESVAVDRERFDLLEEVVDALEDGVAVLEGSTVRFANAALFELTGAETLVGRAVDAVVDDDLAAAIRERARSPAVRWMTPLSGTLAGDDGREVDVYVAPLSDERTLCVVRDGRRSGTAALAALERAIATVRTADAPGEVRRAVVEAALDRTGADLACWYRREDDVLRPAVVEAAADPGSIDLAPIETGDRAETDLLARLAAEADDAVAGRVFDRSELDPLLARAGIRAERVLAVSAGDHGVVLATSTDPASFGEYDRLPLEAVVGAATTTLEGLERATAVRTCRASLDRLESVVERCRRLREAERSLLAADARDDLERRLCEALVALPFEGTPGTIEFAWVGAVETGADRVTPSRWAGEAGVDLESVAVSIDPDADPTHPAARAATTLEPAAVADLEAVAADGEWSRRLLEAGIRSVYSVPLVVDEFCFGVLTVGASQPSAFDDATRAACDHLAAVTAHAIAALERQRALLSDRVTELEVVLRDDEEPLSAVAGVLDRRLDVQAVVPRSAGGATVFAVVSDGVAVPAERLVESIPSLESGRVVGDRGTASVLELVFADTTVATTLAAHGGVLRSVVPMEDRTRLLVDLSSTVDVRGFVRMLERRHPGATLAARRERDRSVQPVRAFDAELRDRLSERQLRTLETAYYSGFFEWPRESTGEEVADAIGVSQPTFSRHLRVAQGKLFALLFDDRTGTDEQ